MPGLPPVECEGIVTEISERAQVNYDTGVHPLDFAAGEVAELILAHARVALARQRRPLAYPAHPGDLTVDALGYRIVGAFLAAGWTPPEVPGVTEPAPWEAT
jgi:hypothetical protein